MARSRVIVSEKTLELNVAAEIVQTIRGAPGCEAAFWIGMKQHQKALNGIDEVLSNLPSAKHLALQFKAPRARPPDTAPYVFAINEHQHSPLCRLAASRPNAVFYVLPHYNSFPSVRQRSPSLLDDTWFFRISDIGPLQGGSSSGSHTIRSWPGWAQVYSSPGERTTTFSFKDIVGEILSLDAPGDKLTSSSQLEFNLLSTESVREWFVRLREEAKNTHQVGQLLRGFCLACIS